MKTRKQGFKTRRPRLENSADAQAQGKANSPALPRPFAAPALVLVLTAVYFVAGKLGLILASVHASATAVWPPAGIALAGLLVLGYRVWPGIFFGAFLVNITTAGSVATSMGIAAGNTLEGLAGAYLVNRFANGVDVFLRPQNILKFVLLAGLTSTAVSATFGVTVLSAGGYADWADYGAIWLTWWLGDAAGNLLVAPALLLWSVTPRARWTRRQIVEAVFLLLLLLLVGVVVFGGFLPFKARNYALDFTCLPLLIWAAFRFGPRETATVSLALSAIAIWGTLLGLGPFALDAQNESLLLLQGFMGVTAVTAMAVAAVVSERRSAERALRESHDALDLRIQERTRVLSIVVKELEGEVLQRLRAEKELQGKTEELSRSNTELEQFATVVSHELQEPLRKILTFGNFLKTSNAAPEQEERQYAQKMEEAAKRMQRLVEDILNLSRVTSGAKPPEPVDLDAVLREVAADFDGRVAQIGGEIKVEPLPTVKAENLQMRQLFANLISNAYKFRKKDEPLRIAVSCRRHKEGFVVIAVEDNGIGFDEQYLDRIFKPFQRLHRRGDYEGSGMGLAICQRIIMRHGGEITARSQPAKGATFIVTLPA